MSSSSLKPNHELKCLKDPVFEIGKDYLKENKYDEAIEFFSGVLQQRGKDLGSDMDIGCASAWYEYGNALLLKEEDSPSDNLLSNSEKPKSSDDDEEESPEDILVDNNTEENENNDESNEPTENNNQSTQGKNEDEDISDLQIAWESLEVARKIYEQNRNNSTLSSIETIDIPLSNVYIRLGDLEIINNNFQEAFDDYNRALHIRQQYCNDFDRLLSDCYYSLALAYIYSSGSNSSETSQSSTQSHLLPIDGKIQALKYYKLSKEVMDKWMIYQSNRIELEQDLTIKQKMIEDYSIQRELIDEVNEAIQGLEEEIKTMQQEGGTTAPTGVTTIGFGQNSGGTTSSVMTSTSIISTNDYFLQQSNVSVNTLQPKKRGASGSISTGPMDQNQSENCVDEAANKRPRVDA